MANAKTTTSSSSLSSSSSFSNNNHKETNKQLLSIRHGISVANEWMSQPGNQWGDATFRDNPHLIDAPLSSDGIAKTQRQLSQQLHEEFNEFMSSGVDLVLISPLTRCLETYQYGVAPVLSAQCQAQNIPMPPVLAVPLLRERVYTKSDTGRSREELAKSFPEIDFSECPENESWWYEPNEEEAKQLEEWRPHGKGQWYAVPGEPGSVFEERMKDLDAWLWNRPERKIIVVAHWGVLRHLTSGTEWENAQARMLEWSFCPVKNETVVSHA